MEKSRLAVAVALVFVMAALMSGPAQVSLSMHGGSASALPAPFVATPAGPVHSTGTAASPTPAASYPRTVLIETFTGVWCIHCPAESQALHYIDENTSANVLDIAELHVCAFATGTGPCLENYVPPDGTSNARGAFYSVCGFPDVFFDGLNPLCGATNSVSQMQQEYDNSIANASMVPATVGIAQSAKLTESGVSEQATISSSVNGSYNAVMYLLEFINKTKVDNGYGPHDVDHVVRQTLFNHPVTLVAGGTNYINVSSGPLNTTWNTRNLSVVTFLQDNSTKQVQNANLTTVATLTDALTANRTTMQAGGNATISLRVANSSTNAPVANAVVNLSWSGGGTFTPSSGVTGTDGSFNATFHSPSVLSTTTVHLSAKVTAANYTTVPATISFVVNPVIAPDVPTGLAVLAANQEVSLNWSVPASGGAGVSYHLYRAPSATGTYSLIETSGSTTFVDSSVTWGDSYWYKVCAVNTGGSSANTSAVAATAVSVVPVGIPANVGWWFHIDTLNVSSPTASSLSLFLPGGFVGYEDGPDSYAYVPAASTGPVSIAGTPLTINVSFIPRYASLAGTVSPADANVTVNGVGVPVVAGAFGELLAAGTYDINVTAPGYVANHTTVTLTPGNLSSVTVNLAAVPSGGGSSTASSSGLTTDDLIGIVAVVIAVVAVLVGVAMITSKGKRGRGGRSGPRPPSAPPTNGTEP